MLTGSRSQECNSKQSGFFGLPAEIRNHIYELVFGGNTIHIATRDRSFGDRGAWSCRNSYRSDYWPTHKVIKFTHAVCSVRTDAEDEAYESSKDAKTAGQVQSYRKRHGCCYSVIDAFTDYHRIRTLGSDGRPPDQLFESAHASSGFDFNFLRVNRQVHEEAALIPYLCNTFAFSSGRDLEFFLSQSLLAPQCSAIKSLQIDGWLVASDPTIGIQASTLKLLSGVTELRVSASVSRPESQGVSLLALPSLESVEVMLRPEQPRIDSGMVRREKARDLELMLMRNAEAKALADDSGSLPSSHPALVHSSPRSFALGLSIRGGG